MSAKTLNDFTSQLRNRNIARPALYHVSLGLPPKMVGSGGSADALSLASMWCASAATPDVTMLTNDNYVEDGTRRKFAYDYDYNDLSLTFYIDQEYVIKKYFDDWMKAIVPYKRRFNYPDDYTADTLFLTILNQADQDTYQYKFKRIYPKSITPVDLNYASGNAISTFTVNFVFEDFEYTKFYIDPTAPTTSAPVVQYNSEPPTTSTSNQTGEPTAVNFATDVSLPDYVTGGQGVLPTINTTEVAALVTPTLTTFMTAQMPTLLGASLLGNLPPATMTRLGANAGTTLTGIISTNFSAFNTIILDSLPPMDIFIASNLPAYGNSVTNIPRMLTDKMPNLISLIVT